MFKTLPTDYEYEDQAIESLIQALDGIDLFGGMMAPLSSGSGGISDVSVTSSGRSDSEVEAWVKKKRKLNHGGWSAE